MARSHQVNPRTPNYGRANFGQISPYRDRETPDEGLSEGDIPTAASQSTSALQEALKPKAFSRMGGTAAHGVQKSSTGGTTGGIDAPQSQTGPVSRALLPSSNSDGNDYFNPQTGMLSGGRAIDYAGLERDYGHSRNQVNQLYGSLAGMGARSTPSAVESGGVGGGAAPGKATFDGKNWQGVNSTTDGGDFSRLSGFNSQKFNDLGNETNDAMTSKYVFGRVASKYDPTDPEALPKIVAELNSMGIPAQYDGKDGIDFGDGYGYIDVQQAWRPEGGGGPFDWMPKGGGGGPITSGTPLQNALLPQAGGAGDPNLQSLLAGGVIDPKDPLWAQILRNLQQGQ